MKNMFTCIITLLFMGCASTGGVSTGGDFKTVYDDVSDVKVITHSDMELGYFYNLKDNMSGERENLRLSIVDKSLVMIADYQDKDWIFINSLVLLDGKGRRLKIENGQRQEEVKNLRTVFVRERYTAIIGNESVSALRDILRSEKPTVSFVGADRRTGKLDIKPKVKSAMIATIGKWQSIQSE